MRHLVCVRVVVVGAERKKQILGVRVDNLVVSGSLEDKGPWV